MKKSLLLASLLLPCAAQADIYFCATSIFTHMDLAFGIIVEEKKGSDINKNFVVYHVNYSKENKNLDLLASLGFPQRFGFPVFVILDGEGNRIHTQNSTDLEEGKGHSTQKTLNFFNNWSPSAIDPKENQKW